MRCIRFLAAGGLAALAMLSTPAFAQQYPAKPVTIIVPFAAGGPLDPSAWMAAFSVLAAGILVGPMALYWSRRVTLQT